MTPSSKSVYAQAASFHARRPSAYDSCPWCGRPKQKVSRICKPCRDAMRKNPSRIVEQDVSLDYRKISLTRGQRTLVDVEDYDSLKLYNWSALWNPKTRSFYAVRNSEPVNGKRTIIWMHREILGLKSGDPRQGDHALHDTLDNRRNVGGKENLRVADEVEQGRNHQMRRDNHTGFTGVRATKSGRFESYVTVAGRQVYLGSRDTARAAFEELYVPAANRQYGKFTSPHLKDALSKA